MQELTFGENTNAAILLAHPNPLSQSASLSLGLIGGDELISHIRITDAMGRVIRAMDVHPGRLHQLSDLSLAPGIYMVTVTTCTDRQLSAHIVVQ